MARNVVITGGAGFIGSHLAEALHAQGRRLVLIDDLSTGGRDNVAALLGNRCELIEGRVSDVLRRQPDVLRDAACVFHLAAAVGVKLVVDDPPAMIRNNIDETAAVLEAAAPARVPVLITSSSEVYGLNPNMPLAEDQTLLYGPTHSSRWSYAMTKALDEHMALAMHRRGQVSAVVVRLFNTIGPRQVGTYGMVVPRFIQRALSGEALEIYGDGRQTRSFCDVRDVVRALTGLMNDPNLHGRVFNVGCDAEITIDALAQRVIALTGGGEKRYVPYDQAYERGFEDPQRRVPDLTRLRQAIDFKPRYTLDDTLKDLITTARAVATG